MVVLSVALSIRYGDYKGNTENAYTYGDTQIVTYSTSFCEGLSLSSDVGAELYLLKDRPLLSGPVNNLTVQPKNGVTVNADTYYYLNYKLHTGSNVQMNYCLEEGSSHLNFYFIKGKDNFNDWEGDGSATHSKVDLLISNACTSGNMTWKYDITASDTYYFAFDNVSKKMLTTVKVTLFFHRTEYVVSNSSIADSCSIVSSGKCTVQVPYDSHYTGLLKVRNIDAIVTNDENFSVSWSCNSRAWIYVVIVVIPIIFVVLVLIAMLTVCICCARRHKKGSTTVQDTSVATEDNTPVNAAIATPPTAPPPVNPDYRTIPPTHEDPRPAVPRNEDPPPYGFV